jgi:uncharacterized protein YjbI with pentapeptide repeats
MSSFFMSPAGAFATGAFAGLFAGAAFEGAAFVGAAFVGAALVGAAFVGAALVGAAFVTAGLFAGAFVFFAGSVQADKNSVDAASVVTVNNLIVIIFSSLSSQICLDIVSKQRRNIIS